MGLFSDFLGSQGRKESARQADIANQSQEFINIIDQYLAQLIPGSQEYNDLTAFGQKYLSQIAAGEMAVPELGGSVLDQQPAAMQYGKQLVDQYNARIAAGGPATALESRTDQTFQGLS